MILVRNCDTPVIKGEFALPASGTRASSDQRSVPETERCARPEYAVHNDAVATEFEFVRVVSHNPRSCSHKNHHNQR